MALIVHKYGGTSMGSTERIASVAKRVAKWARAGHRMVVVPSAMSGETNRLLALAKELSPAKSTPALARELDMIAATGEQVSVGLLAIALQAEGMPSVSYAGWQVPIRTDSAYTKARIASIDDARVRADLAAGKVVIITGFQGVDGQGNVTTLGRGGSDTSAVAVAAALKADECLIYTDVDGVYTTDPRIVPEARRLHTVSFEEMLEMASLGSKVLQIRSVEFAGKYRVPLRVLSSFTPWDIAIDEEARSGTLITFEEDVKMEQAVVSGIAFNRDEAKVSLLGVPDKPGVAYQPMMDEIIAKYKPRLQGKKVMLYVGGLRPRHVIGAYEDLGMEVIGTGYEFAHNDDYDRTIKEMGDATLLYDDVTGFELEEFVKRLKPDMVGSGIKEKYIFQKMGIPLRQMHSWDYSGPYHGYDGFAIFARDMDIALSNPTFKNLVPPWKKVEAEEVKKAA